MAKVKRWALTTALAVAVLLGVSAAAFATPGTLANTGNIEVQDVWTYEFVQSFTPSVDRTVTVDCPAGTEVVTGYGVYTGTLQGRAEDEVGSALDADSWTVTFHNGTGSTLSSYLQVHATCV